MRWLPGIAVAVMLGLGALLLAWPDTATEYFAADFETGDLSQWEYVQALPDGVEAVEGSAGQGSYAGRFEVEEGDEEPDTGSQRAEVRTDLEFTEGDVRYFRFLTRVESWDYDYWGLLWQIHDQTEGSPPLSLQIQEGEESEPTVWVGPGDDTVEYWRAPLPEGWFEIVIEVEFGEEGSVSVWLDGRRQTLLNGRTSYEDVDTLGEGPGYDKIGVYRSASSEDTAVVYHDGYRVTDELFSDPPE